MTVSLEDDGVERRVASYCELMFKGKGVTISKFSFEFIIDSLISSKSPYYFRKVIPLDDRHEKSTGGKVLLMHADPANAKKSLLIKENNSRNDPGHYSTNHPWLLR